jgi:predicted transcriptional regulator
VTQRELSKKLGIAIGMTNNYLKRLAKTAYIEINKGRHKPLHWLLTPKGTTERTAMIYQYLMRSYLLK